MIYAILKAKAIIGVHRSQIRIYNNRTIRRPPYKNAYWKTICFISHPKHFKHMLWVSFEHPKHMFKLMGKKKNQNFTLIHCKTSLSESMCSSVRFALLNCLTEGVYI